MKKIEENQVKFQIIWNFPSRIKIKKVFLPFFLCSRVQSLKWCHSLEWCHRRASCTIEKGRKRLGMVVVVVVVVVVVITP
jgi:hypothetical protein